MLLLSLAFFAGVLILQSFPALPPSDLIAAVLPFLFTYALYQPKIRLAIVLFLGFFWANWQAEQQLRLDIPPQLWQQKLALTVKVQHISRAYDNKTEFDAQLIAAERPEIKAQKLRLTWYHRNTPKPDLEVGETWRLWAKLKPAIGYRNQHSRDHSLYLYRQHIRHQGAVQLKPELPRRLAAAEFSGLNHIRQQILQAIRQGLGEHPQRGLVEALTIGVREEISYQDWQTLKHTGTSHLMAISGLHIGYAAAAAWLLFSWLYRHSAPIQWLNIVPVPTVAFVAMIFGAGFYAALSGFAIPAQRALMMLTIPVLARLLFKRVPLDKALLPTFVLILLWDSSVVLSASFYLSFVAVALIFWGISAYPHQDKRTKHAQDKSLKTKYRPSWSFLAPVKNLFWVSTVIMIGMLPLTLFWFGGASWISPFANLIAIPAVALLILPLIFFALALLPFSASLSGELWTWSADALGYVFWYLHQLENIGLYWDYGAINAIQLLIALFATVLFLLPKGVLPRWLLGLCVFLLLYRPESTLKPGMLQVSVFDVGQGLAILLRTEKHSLLYDTGTRKATRQVVLPHLKAVGITHLDSLLLSHNDYDHSGGTSLLDKTLSIGQLFSSEPQAWQQLGLPITHCQRGQTWQWDGVDFEILHPLTTYELRTDNDNSCVLKVSTGTHSLLITGDISRRAEGFLLQMQYDKLKSDVLIIPHHGSNSSSRQRFIKTVAPQWAIASTGFLNPYRHPRMEVVQAYQTQGAKVLDTAQTGEIQLFFDASHRPVEVKTQARRYWQALYD